MLVRDGEAMSIHVGERISASASMSMVAMPAPTGLAFLGLAMDVIWREVVEPIFNRIESVKDTSGGIGLEG